jgi:large subunit ribosomal protein L23
MIMEKYYKILKQPVVTESTFDLIDEHNKIVFLVKRSANKYQIREAIERIYGVKVMKVNTMITPSGTKKAFIKLLVTIYIF